MTRFGGPDKRSQSALGGFRYGLFISPLVDNSDAGLQTFLQQRYFAEGAALFGRETAEEMDDFRRAAGGALDNVSDANIAAIIQFAVQRVRNYGRLDSLHKARFEYARIVSLGGHCGEVCSLLDGKLLPVKTAWETVQWLSERTLEEQGYMLYGQPAAQDYRRDPLAYIRPLVTDDKLPPALVAQVFCLPPFTERCGCRLEGYFSELG